MRVLVIGDSCQDVFIYGDIERISPEAPVPVFKPTHTEKNDGMAKNVANNVESLDMHIYTTTNGNSIVKKRYVENRSGQMVLRVDEHDYCDRIKIKKLQGITNNKFTSYSLTGTVDKIDAADDALIEVGDDFGFNETTSFFQDFKEYSPSQNKDVDA